MRSSSDVPWPASGVCPAGALPSLGHLPQLLSGPSDSGSCPSVCKLHHTNWGVDMYLFSLGSESPKGAIGHIVPTEKSILAVERNKVLLPPLGNRTFSWGFDDFSCCLGNYGSDKVGGRGARARAQGLGLHLLGQRRLGDGPAQSRHSCPHPTTSMWLCPLPGREECCTAGLRALGAKPPAWVPRSGARRFSVHTDTSEQSLSPPGHSAAWRPLRLALSLGGKSGFLRPQSWLQVKGESLGIQLVPEANHLASLPPPLLWP